MDDDADGTCPRIPWLVSYRQRPTHYHQVRIVRSGPTGRITKVHVLDESLTTPTASTQMDTPTWHGIHVHAWEVLETSLQTEQGVATQAMPATQVQVWNENHSKNQTWRTCYAGECAMGNLVADALVWWETNRHASVPTNNDLVANATSSPLTTTTTHSPDDSSPSSYSLPVVAVVPSFMVRGPGCPAGEIRTLEVLENIPYATQRCAMTMTGLSLVRLMQVSVATATLDGFDTGTKTGGRFLQVAGMRVTLHAYGKPPANDSDKQDRPWNQVTAIDIWNPTTHEYDPVVRTQLYRVASCQHLCATFSKFPSTVSAETLVEAGEVPATKVSDCDLKQDVLDYLKAVYYEQNQTYIPQVQGRIQIRNRQKNDDEPTSTIRSSSSNNKTEDDEWMNRGAFSAYQERDDCVAGVTYWSSSLLQCEPCPTYQGVIFSKPSSALQGQAFSSQPLTDVVTLTNTEPFSIVVIPETLALPTNLELVLSTSDNRDSHSNTSESAYHTEWMADHSHDTNSSDQLLAMSQDPGSPHSHVTPVSYLLEPNEPLNMKILFDPSQRIAGTDTSSVLLNVMNTNTSRNDFSSCPGYKFKFDIVAQLSMSSQQNHLEGVTAFGYTSAALIMLTALFCHFGPMPTNNAGGLYHATSLSHDLVPWCLCHGIDSHPNKHRRWCRIPAGLRSCLYGQTMVALDWIFHFRLGSLFQIVAHQQIV